MWPSPAHFFLKTKFPRRKSESLGQKMLIFNIFVPFRPRGVTAVHGSRQENLSSEWYRIVGLFPRVSLRLSRVAALRGMGFANNFAEEAHNSFFPYIKVKKKYFVTLLVLFSWILYRFPPAIVKMNPPSPTAPHTLGRILQSKIQTGRKRRGKKKRTSENGRRANSKQSRQW